MKVGVKFALAFVASGLSSVVVYSSVAAGREVDQLQATVAEDLASLGRQLSVSVLATWDRDGETAALDMVAMHDRDEAIDVRWTWLDVDGNHSAFPRGGSAVIPSLLRGQQQTWVGATPDGRRSVYAYVPLVRPTMRPAALEFSRSLVSESRVFWSELKDQLFFSSLVVAFATALAVSLTSWFVSRPLARVAEQARRIGRGELDHKLPVQGDDEVAALVEEQNAMCDALADARAKLRDEADRRVAALEQLRHADRLRTVGTLASGIAHEIGTPLNVIALRAKMIGSGEATAEEAPANAKIIVAQSERVIKIVRQLLDFARRRPPNRSKADLGEIAERTSQLLAALAKKSAVRLRVTVGDPLVAEVDPEQIEQALTNLIINAIQAMPSGGEVSVTVRRESATRPKARQEDAGQPMPCARIDVADTGSGIAPENLERIFEPFFTTKGVGDGTGLGLSVTHGILEDHGGWLCAESSVGRGTVFSLYLPIEQVAAA